MRYSVIIPTYNNWEAIRRVVQAVVDQAGDVEVIVVDSSIDGTDEKLRAAFPTITLIHPPTRLLPGPARNLGAQQASGDVLIFLDGDCRPDAGWLRALIGASAGLDAGVVCGSVDLDEPADLSQFMEYVFWKLAATSTIARGPYNFVITDNLMMRRSDFLKTGGFRESDSANDAQMDVSLQRAGLPVTMEPTARVFHIHTRGWGFHIAKLYRVGAEQLPLMLRLKEYRVGRWTLLLLPVVFLIRWLRITTRVLRFRPEYLPRYVLVQPMLWLGLVVYQAGLWNGLARWLAGGAREEQTAGSA